VSKPSIRELIDDSRNGPADGNVLLLLPKDREAFDVLMVRAHAGFLLAERVEKVLALHSKYGIYDECGHDHAAEGPGVFDVAEVGLTCAEGLLYEVCHVCHFGHDGEPDEFTGDEHWPCATVRLLNGEDK
jgi:hypothetical protein